MTRRVFLDEPFRAKDPLAGLLILSLHLFVASPEITWYNRLMREKLLQLKSFHWHLWIALCSLALIPAVYQTIRTLLIYTGNQNEVFNIIGQMEWFDLINETLQAFLVVPLYSILNKILKKTAGPVCGRRLPNGTSGLRPLRRFLYGSFSLWEIPHKSFERRRHGTLRRQPVPPFGNCRFHIRYCYKLCPGGVYRH